jgi:hypothetical protein
VAVLEELQDPVRQLHDLERVVWLDDLGAQMAHQPERFAASQRIVPRGPAPWTVAGLVRVVHLLPLGREGSFERGTAAAAEHVAEADDGRCPIPMP